jgi:hypothetical protein
MTLAHEQAQIDSFVSFIDIFFYWMNPLSTLGAESKDYFRFRDK